MKTKTPTTNSLKFKTQKTLRTGEILKVSIRLNDECHNGHEDFAITGELGTPRDYARGNQSGGCIHEEILKHFPEFAPFVRIHLCDWEGSPMHGVANGFYWFQGFVPESVDHSSRLGPCHGGTGSGAKSAEECKRILMESFRATEEDIAAIVAACPRTKEEFSHAVEKLGFRARWQAEAEAATRLLESLIDPDPETAPRFESKATRRNWEPLAPETVAVIEERIASGYYLPETVAARDKAARIAAKQAKIESIEKDHAATVAKSARNRDVDLFFARHDLPGNWIYYDHTNEISVNWSRSEKLMTRAEFDTIAAEILAFPGELPNGVKLVWNERPKY